MQQPALLHAAADAGSAMAEKPFRAWRSNCCARPGWAGGLGKELARPVGAFAIPAVILGLWFAALQVDRALHLSRVRKVHLLAVNGFSILLMVFRILVLNVGQDSAPLQAGLATIPGPFGPEIENAFTCFVLLGLLLIGVALPMVLSIVPPNKWYGHRTKRTLEDRDEWYRVNRRSGLLMAAVGGILMSAAAILYFAADLSASTYYYICMGIAVGGVIVAAVMGPRGRPEERQTD